MRKAQQELRENLKKADADLEKFLGLIEKANQKQIDLRDREALLHKVVSLPINNPDLLKGLFREKAGGNNIKSLLDDLLVYHNLVATIDKLKSLEAMAQDETKSPDSQNRLSTLRHSLEHNLKQVTFKALQCTVNLVNKDIGSLLQLPEVSLTRILKPLCQLKDLRPVFFSQYGAHQKLRIKDVVTSWHISIRKGSIENLFQFTMETLTRYCASDLNVFEGVFGNKQPREIAELINGLYVEEFDNLLTSLKKLFKENAHALDINQTGSMMRATVRFWNILPTLHKVYSELCQQGASQKLPEFLNKYEQILTLTENFIDKQLQAIEGRLDKISKDHLSPSAIDEVARNLSELHFFYASAQPTSKSMFFATKHSLLYPLRPFMNLSTRLLADKNNTNTLLYGIQVISRLQQLSKTTVLADSAPDFFQKMTKQLLDSMGIIASGLSHNIQETIKKQPDDIKRQVLLLALLPDSSNPNFSAFKTIKPIKEKAGKRHLAEEYYQNLVDLAQKILPKDKDLINSLNRTPISEFLSEENIQFN